MLPTATALLASGAIFGLYLGDELVWNGLPAEDLETVAATVRADLPNAITWVNEAKPPFMQQDAHQFMTWAAMDDRGNFTAFSNIFIVVSANICNTMRRMHTCCAVAAVVPYHWNYCPHCMGTRNEIGAREMNGTREAWQSFGRKASRQTGQIYEWRKLTSGQDALRVNATAQKRDK
eukprot:scaffold570922_cov47-Prasinocladus_malaysianus.AAC.2